MPAQFDHEKLKVYQVSLQFAAVATELLERIPKALAAHNQLDRASTAIALNIAEGTGKWTMPDRCRFYDIARGSALECAACLDVLAVKKLLATREVAEAKGLLVSVVSMLVGLTKAIAPNRVYEEPDGIGEV